MPSRDEIRSIYQAGPDALVADRAALEQPVQVLTARLTENNHRRYSGRIGIQGNHAQIIVQNRDQVFDHWPGGGLSGCFCASNSHGNDSRHRSAGARTAYPASDFCGGLAHP